MSFSPTDRLDTRLTVVDWPTPVDEELEKAVLEITTFELANDAPAALSDPVSRHLAWRGYLTGGVLTLYERLGGLFADRQLSAFFADPHLEVFVPYAGEVTVLGTLRYPIQVGHDDWKQCVAKAGSSKQLSASFLQRALDGASSVITEAREAAARSEHTISRPRPAAIPQIPPGEVDFDLLDESDATLTEHYDPDGLASESWASCQMLRWRTDFLAPGTDGVPGQDYLETLSWRVAQWEWVDDVQMGADEYLDEPGEWTLRAWMPISASEAMGHLPSALAAWVRRFTRIGRDDATALADEADPDARAYAMRLSKELEAL